MRRTIASSVFFVLLLALVALPASGGQPAGRRIVAMPGPVSQGCLACHTTLHGVLSHPVGPRPTATSGLVTSGLPLEAGGGVGCLTCHGDELADHGLTGRPASGLHLRRTPGALCASCHTPLQGPQNGRDHALLGRRAHLAPSSDDGHGAVGLDRESRGCLGCHDGSTASAAAVHEGGRGRNLLGAARALSGEHPVGIEYDGLRGWQRGSLRPPSSLPSAVRLFDGRVGCGSCHSVYAPGPGLLVRQGDRNLCLSCHIK